MEFERENVKGDKLERKRARRETSRVRYSKRESEKVGEREREV